MRPRNIFVTGATGFIGSHLVERLLAIGSKVCIVLRPESNTWRIDHLRTNKNLKIYKNEIRGMNLLFSEQKIDCVVHLAAKYFKEHHTHEEIQEMMAANIVFPAVLLDIMRQHGVSSIITAGTFFEYDLHKKRNIISESSPIKPYNVYARTKISLSDLVKDYTDWYGFKGVHLRLFPPYGPKDNEKLILYLIKGLLQKKSVHLTPGAQRWNYTYITDTIEAIVRGVEYCLTMKSKFDVINVGQTQTVSIKKIANMLEIQLENKGLLSYDKPYLPNEIYHVACDGKKALKKLGWSAKIGIEEGLSKTGAYYKDSRNKP